MLGLPGSNIREMGFAEGCIVMVAERSLCPWLFGSFRVLWSFPIDARDGEETRNGWRRLNEWVKAKYAPESLEHVAVVSGDLIEQKRWTAEVSLKESKMLADNTVEYLRQKDQIFDGNRRAS
jgi:hypothetical protein